MNQNSDELNVTTSDDGVRCVQLPNLMKIPVYHVPVYRAIGMLSADTPDFVLTEAELDAKNKSDVFYQIKNEIQEHINQFNPINFDDIESFIEELKPYLLEYDFSIGNLRTQLSNKLSGPLPQLYGTSNPETYLLYLGLGLKPTWKGEGNAPKVNDLEES